MIIRFRKTAFSGLLLCADTQEFLNHGRKLHDDRGEDDCHHAHQFYEDVQGGTRCIFAGIADRVTDHCCPMNRVFASVRQLFTTEIAFFDMLFRIVPRSAGIVQQTCQREPGGEPASRSPISPATPRIRPVATGVMIASREGSIISRWAPLVEISTQRA